MNETIEWAIINDGYRPSRTEIIEMAERLLDFEGVKYDK